MILVDTSVWIDHFRQQSAILSDLLARRLVLMHPHVVGELAVGNFHHREAAIRFLQRLKTAVVASHGEVLSMIEKYRLHGRGIGYTDAHLLASARLTLGSRLWSRDKHLATIARDLSLGADL